MSGQYREVRQWNFSQCHDVTPWHCSHNSMLTLFLGLGRLPSAEQRKAALRRVEEELDEAEEIVGTLQRSIRVTLPQSSQR
jgi:hypothetical protein